MTKLYIDFGKKGHDFIDGYLKGVSQNSHYDYIYVKCRKDIFQKLKSDSYNDGAGTKLILLEKKDEFDGKDIVLV